MSLSVKFDTSYNLNEQNIMDIEKARSACGGICFLTCSIPWLITILMFAYQGVDPDSCWVTEGQLYVSQNRLGVENERDVAETWRHLYQYLFAIYLALTIFPCFVTILSLSCMGDHTDTCR